MNGGTKEPESTHLRVGLLVNRVVYCAHFFIFLFVRRTHKEIVFVIWVLELLRVDVRLFATSGLCLPVIWSGPFNLNVLPHGLAKNEAPRPRAEIKSDEICLCKAPLRFSTPDVPKLYCGVAIPLESPSVSTISTEWP